MEGVKEEEEEERKDRKKLLIWRRRQDKVCILYLTLCNFSSRVRTLLVTQWLKATPNQLQVSLLAFQPPLKSVTCLLVCLFVCLFVHLFAHSFVRSFVYSLVCQRESLK